jgi:hypothetical protein
MPSMTLQAAAASVFCGGRVWAWRRRPIRVLSRIIATSPKDRPGTTVEGGVRDRMRREDQQRRDQFGS